jgi:hypothetical protein
MIRPHSWVEERQRFFENFGDLRRQLRRGCLARVILQRMASSTAGDAKSVPKRNSAPINAGSGHEALPQLA